MFHVGTPVKIDTMYGDTPYGTVTRVWSNGRYVTVVTDAGATYVRDYISGKVEHRTLTLMGEPHYFDLDGDGVMTLWAGEPGDYAPQSVADERNTAPGLWLYLWSKTD